MAQGLTSAGGSMDEVPENSLVLLFAEGKEHPLGVGITMKSTEEIRKENQGHVVKNLHVIGDELWMLKDFKKSSK